MSVTLLVVAIFSLYAIITLIMQIKVFKIARKNNFSRENLTEADKIIIRKVSGWTILTFVIAVILFILVFYFNRKK